MDTREQLAQRSDGAMKLKENDPEWLDRVRSGSDDATFAYSDSPTR